MNQDDNKLSHLFRELRDEDAQRGPSFDRVVRRTASRSEVEPRVALLWLQVGMSAAFLVALCASIFVFHHGKKPQISTVAEAVDTQKWAALSNWSASTDGLLAMSGNSWGSSSTITTPTDSWLQNNTNESDSSQTSM
jgi:hypothetical protein